MERPARWFEAIAEHSPDAVIVLDRAGIIRYGNAAATKLARRSGASEKNIAGMKYEDIIKRSRIYDEAGAVPDPATFPSAKALRDGIASREVVFEQVYGGTHYWLSVSCVPIKDERGAAEYAVLYFRDISRKKLGEDKLQLLIESSKILSITTDFNTRLVEKARLMVPAMADWCTVNVVNAQGRLERIAIIHRDPSKVTLVERLAELSATKGSGTAGIYGVLMSGESQFVPVVSKEFLTKSGSPERLKIARELSVCSSMIVPIKSGGAVVGVLSVAYAESERHYSEEDLTFIEEFCRHLGILIDNANLYAEIRARDESKDAFLNALSHELRNPLAPIKSSLELMIATSPDEMQRSELRIVEHQFNHLAKLLDDLLDVRRYALGKIRLKRVRTVLQEHIRRIAEAHAPFIREKHIDFEVLLPQDEIVVWADQTRLEQALGNILHNAEKFTPPRGRISLQARVAGEKAFITIADSGSGMERDELIHLFDFNEHRKESDKSGLGIGLVLVREIARLHGGSVAAESAGRGAGSTFTLTIPTTMPDNALSDAEIVLAARR